jgi:hypothetical protein
MNFCNTKGIESYAKDNIDCEHVFNEILDGKEHQTYFAAKYERSMRGLYAACESGKKYYQPLFPQPTDKCVRPE